MIKSCQECQRKCCKSGPGPYRKVSPKEAVKHWGLASSYNTVCMWLTEDEKCGLWGFYSLPIECRTYVCHIREFSNKELDDIKKLENGVQH